MRVNIVPFGIGFGLALAVALPARAMSVIPPGTLIVTTPGTVLMVDSTDAGTGDKTYNIDATLPVARYDFGFVDIGGFNAIALSPSGPASLYGTYAFTGGTIVDFALRDTLSGDVYSMSDPLDYVDQFFLYPIDPSHSANPVVSTTYYHALVLEWDLDHNGFDELFDPGLTLTYAVNQYDGMLPTGAPVPLPASAALFGSALAGWGGAGWFRQLRIRRSA
jgi:hypothetical protein